MLARMLRKESSADLMIQNQPVRLLLLLSHSLVDNPLSLCLDLLDDGWIWAFRPTGNLTEEELEDWVAEGALVFYPSLRH